MTKYPFTNKPADILKLLQLLPTIDVPAGKIDERYIKSLGFSPASGKHLFNILKNLGFIDDKDEPSVLWIDYAKNDQRGLILASAVKKAYSGLFSLVICPYLEGDEMLLDFFKHAEKASDRDTALMLETFRVLSELGDFQDLMCDLTSNGTPAAKEEPRSPEVKVNPSLQLNIQIHIDPDTPDEKIETIFKNMRKYLIDKQEDAHV